MRKKIFQWLHREFVTLSCEGNSKDTPDIAAARILAEFDEELHGNGLSLAHTVRTRLWARDSESRTLASNERFRILSGKARSASSSYISPDHFESSARVGMDLTAMRPSRWDENKTLVEYEPPINPLRYLAYDSIHFFSGVTSVRPSLVDQVEEILSHISASLDHGKVSWDQVVKASCFLHRSQSLATLRNQLDQAIHDPIPFLQFGLVDGYSAEGKLLEVEVTAQS